MSTGDQTQPSSESPNANAIMNTNMDSNVNVNHSLGNVTIYQTSGPDAYSSPITAADGSGPVLNPRSCVACRRRKVRCDKQMPCSNCRRALIPCAYPAPGRAPRQPRPKDPNAPPKPSSSSSSQREVDLVKRLRKLEGIVEELSGQVEVDSASGGGSAGTGAGSGRQQGASSTGSPSSPARNNQPGSKRASAVLSAFSKSNTGGAFGSQDADSPSSDGSPWKDINTHLGRLVLNDHKGNTRYITQGIWSKINDELDNLRADTQHLSDDDSEHSDYDATPEESPTSGGGHVEDHHSFILGYRSADVNLLMCHPQPAQAAFLWSTYQTNVEPLMKILHIPTLDGIMQDARQNPESIPPGTESLVFAVFFAALVSLEPEDTLAKLGSPKDVLLRQYRFALEQSLARANFLFTSDLAVLQAFTLFLMVVRSVDDSRFCWTLTGLVIRLAQGMGLQRDGSQFDLTPFETEMRRRLWWAILVLDLRSAEELGTDLIVTEASYDTQLPSNINDTDISPESTEPPIQREGRSDTAITLCRYEILLLSRRFITELAFKHEQLTPHDRETLLIEAYQRIENKFLKHVVDETDPLYWVGAMVARVIMAKMCLHIYQSKMFTGNDSDLSAEIRDRLWVAAIEVVELGQRLNADERCRHWRWLFMTYTNWHAIAFNLIELCRRPWTALAERSWQAVVGFEGDPMDLSKKGDHAAVFLPLRKLYHRVRKHRDAEIFRLKANIPEARRLDWAERMNPTSARFGPIPGEPNAMDKFRERWWHMIQPGGLLPSSYSDPSSDPSSTGAASSKGAAGFLRPAQQLSQSASPASAAIPHAAPQIPMGTIPSGSTGVSTGIPPAPGLDFSDAAMEMLDDFMAQPNPNLASFWPSLNMAAYEKGIGFGRDGTAVPDAQGQMPLAGDAVQQQQQPQPAQQSTTLTTDPESFDKHLPPYLWSNDWEDGQNTSLPQGEQHINGLGDLDMFEGDFDWQNWGQNLANFKQ